MQVRKASSGVTQDVELQRPPQQPSPVKAQLVEVGDRKVGAADVPFNTLPRAHSMLASTRGKLPAIKGVSRSEKSQACHCKIVNFRHEYQTCSTCGAT